MRRRGRPGHRRSGHDSLLRRAQEPDQARPTTGAYWTTEERADRRDRVRGQGKPDLPEEPVEQKQHPQSHQRRLQEARFLPALSKDGPAEFQAPAVPHAHDRGRVRPGC